MTPQEAEKYLSVEDRRAITKCLTRIRDEGFESNEAGFLCLSMLVDRSITFGAAQAACVVARQFSREMFQFPMAGPAGLNPSRTELLRRLIQHWEVEK